MDPNEIKTLEGLQEAIQAEVEKGEKADLNIIAVIGENIVAVGAKSVAEALKESILKEDLDQSYVLKSDVASLEDKVAELESQLKAEKLKKTNPHEARMQRINGGTQLETINILDYDEDGKALAAEEVEARINVESFSVPGLGLFSTLDVVSKPEQHQEVIQKLMEMKSSILVIEKRKKLTKKQIENLIKE